MISTSNDSALTLKRTKAIFAGLAILAGIVQAWSYRFAIEPDGVNYLDIANAYARHDWANAINAYWSPLYSWLLMCFLWLTRAPLYWESTLMHVVNIVMYVAALYCFSIFLDELAALCSGRDAADPTRQGLQQRDWVPFGYALFVYAALDVYQLGTDTPDVGLAALVFLATAILIRMRRGNHSYRLFAALGATLGVSYLTKGVMFPLSFAFLGVAFLIAGAGKKALYRSALAFVIFTAIAGPFVTALSHAKGRFTFGDTGKIAYAILVNGIPEPSRSHWWGQVPGAGVPIHGVRLLNADPQLAEFATPIQGTYPVFYDPSYWYDGARPHFTWRGQVHAMRANLTSYFLLLSAQKEFLSVLFILLLFSADWRGFARNFAALWPIWIPAAATLGIYSLVLVEPRYVMTAIVIVWCSLFTAVRLPAEAKSRRLLRCATLGIALILTITLAKSTVGDVARILRTPQERWWEIAMTLRQHGLAPGQKVAVIGHANVADYWAHLAQLRVVADIPLDYSGHFWGADKETQSRILALFAGTGARAVVTRDPPALRWPPGWEPISDTGYAVLYLDHAVSNGVSSTLRALQTD